jgi:PTH1 family peptidyl-tRNA hydrolase
VAGDVSIAAAAALALGRVRRSPDAQAHEQVGSPEYLRVRMGVGKPERVGGGRGDGNVANHVLSDFPATMAHEVDELVGRATDAVEAILARGVLAAMNEFNGDARA